MKLLKHNPEVQKYVWTELTPNRIVAISILLAALFIVGAVSSSGNIAGVINRIALIVWFIISVFWGSKLTADSLIDEVNNKTWDWQRMACQSPQNIILGKLFGSAILAWYGSLICMAVYFFTCFYISELQTNLLIGINTLLYGVLSNACALLIILFSIHRQQTRAKLKANFYLLFIIFPAISYLVLILYKSDYIHLVSWYNLKFSVFQSYFSSLIFLVFWALVGLVRQARRELYYQNGIKIWISFLISSMIYFSGFLYSAFPDKTLDFVAVVLLIGAAVVLSISYCLLFSEYKDMAVFRQMYQFFKIRNYTKIGYIIPLWLISLIFAIIVSVIGLIVFCLVQDKDQILAVVIVFSILLFAIRDFGFSLLMQLRNSDRKNDKLFLLYIIGAYALPIWFFSFSNMDANQKIIASIFFPIFDKQTHLYYILPSLIQSSIIVYFLIKKSTLSIQPAAH